MTEPGPSEARRRTKKSSGVNTGKELYRPTGRPAIKTRSPYLFRPSETKYEEESGAESELVEDSEAEVEMSKKGEEGEVASLLRYLVEKDANDREERKAAEEVNRREKEAKAIRKREAAEANRKEKEEEAARMREAEERNRKEREEETTRMREAEERARRLKEEEEDRRRGEEVARRREEEERRRTSRLEDDRVRERRELLLEKLKGLGVYKEENELGAYSEKFERIMREGKISESDWGERL